ncbi:MAG: hypothetical protein AB8F78_12775 [Saprospiraceae bacterium]
MRTRILFLTLALFITSLARAAEPVSQLEVRYLPIGAMLSWSCSNMDVTGFTIERSSDGFSFELLSRVVAEKGLAESYNYLDTDRPDDTQYYRVTSFDREGTSAHSPLAEVSAPGNSTWSLTGGFTVDVETQFDFEVESQSVTMLACDLYDFLGNPVSSVNLLVQPGPNQLTIMTEEIAAGAYRLNVAGESISEVVHFVKVLQDEELEAQPLVRGN